MSKESVLVSACLIGVPCRFDGKDALSKKLLQALIKTYHIVPICPEELGGLPTPRPRAMLTGSSEDFLKGLATITDANNKDLKIEFLKGAKESLTIAREQGIKKAYLKDKSPSCGVENIYIQGELRSGTGITANILKNSGIELISVE